MCDLLHLHNKSVTSPALPVPIYNLGREKYLWLTQQVDRNRAQTHNRPFMNPAPITRPPQTACKVVINFLKKIVYSLQFIENKRKHLVFLDICLWKEIQMLLFVLKKSWVSDKLNISFQTLLPIYRNMLFVMYSHT